jgi:hypothetical protein
MVPILTHHREPTPARPETAPTPDTSNDASLAAALSAEEHTTTAPEDSSDSEAETIPVLGPRKTVGEWEKPKKVVGGSTEKVTSGWESASVSRGTLPFPLSSSSHH